MAAAKDLTVDVHWLPYQLSPTSSEEPITKMDGYMKARGMSKEQFLAMNDRLEQKFKSMGLSFKNDEGNMVSNTYEAHRLIANAYNLGGAEAQDKVVELIFEGYFGQGRAPNDSSTLETAAEAAGLQLDVVRNKDTGKTEIDKELEECRKMVTSGVPHFMITGENGTKVEISGAEDPGEFLGAFTKVAS
jgi:predicted DsbA family dithiol-disulfide isomerase